jgi:CRP-like cAMP-binding protein
VNHVLSNADKEIVRRSFLFSGYSQEEFTGLSAQLPFQCAEFEKGDVIFTPENYRRELGIVLVGRVRVTKGDGELVVNSLSMGDSFGAAALFNPAELYVSTLTAKTPCRVAFLRQEPLRDFLDREPRARWNYIYYLSDRIRFLSDKVDYLIQGSGAKKLTSYLLQQVGDDGVVRLDCSMTELAARLSVSRAALYRDLNRLENGGVVQRTGKKITVLDPGMLSLQ